MTLNDMTADPLNVIFYTITKIIYVLSFYHQGGPGTTIGYYCQINFSNDH